MSLFPNEDILTKEIESWKCFANSFSSKEDRKLFTSMLNDCYKYATAINSKGQPFPIEPLIMALLLSQHKMIDWLTKQISKNKSLVNNKREVKSFKEEELGIENPDGLKYAITSFHYLDWILISVNVTIHKTILLQRCQSSHFITTAEPRSRSI